MGSKESVDAVEAEKGEVQRDRVDVLTFGVGHGDCFLVEVVQAGRTEFRLLYDGGVILPEALLKHLRTNCREEGAKDLDVVVLSHVDNDHQGGFHQLFAESDISIGEFWSPCLPAFERLRWLFAPRVAKAVDRAGELEIAAKNREIPVIYPMEDHTDRFAPDKAVTVSVISPARRLLKRLYQAPASAVGELLERVPLPLEWLIRGDDVEEGDGDNFIRSPFDSGTSVSREVLPPGPSLDGLTSENLRQSAAAFAESEGLEFAPDFFGNSVLNDTSLVVVIDVVLDRSHRRRIVLSGDQENWSYISSQHPMGLAPDVLKVPHHGGKVHLWDANPPTAQSLPTDGLGQFFIWMRPRVTVVSAKGLHGLPRSEFREAVRMVGATLVCPNKRNRELLFEDNSSPQARSCFDRFSCSGEQHKVLKLQLSARKEELNSAACVQGNCHRGPAPVVVMQQRLVEPDETFVRWTTGEVRKQAQWLEKFLRDERKKLLGATKDSFVNRLSIDMTSWTSIAAEAQSMRRVQFVANPVPVLRFAAAHGMIWAETEEIRHWTRPDLVAALSEAEYKSLFAWLKRLRGILLVISDLDYRHITQENWFQLVCTSKIEPLMQLYAAKVGLPFEIFKREVMPRLTKDIISHFSARIASLYEPHGRIPWHGSKAILHLYNRNKDVSDFYDEEWLNVGPGYFGEFDDSKLEILFGTDSVLPPFSTPRGIFYQALQPFLEKYYGRDEVMEEGEEIPRGLLPNRFRNAKWLDLW